MKYIGIIILLLLCFNGICQSCDCLTNIKNLVQKVEINYAGFNDKVTAQNRAQYQLLTDSIKKAAVGAELSFCLVLMRRWLAFFRDLHMDISLSPDSSNSEVIRQLFHNTEKIQVSEQDLLNYLNANKRSLDSLEGIWEDDPGLYRIGIMRNKKEGKNDFIGFVLKADSLFWMPGQVKMKVRKNKGKYKVLSYFNRDHVLSAPPIFVTKAAFQMDASVGWRRIYPGVEGVKRRGKIHDPLTPSFKILDKNSCLLVIPSFGFAYKDDIDSLINHNDAVIKSSKHFILDLRNNLGGVVLGFEKLLPLMYTNPIITKGTSVLTSDDNIKSYENIQDDPNLYDSMKAIFRKDVAEMKAHRGMLYNIWPDDTIKFNTVLEYPKRISIIINEHCASSTEYLLLKARQSSKVKIYGKHSMGAIDYADVALLKLPCPLFQLHNPTSRSNRLPEQPLDNIGLQPDVEIPDNTADWVEFVRTRPL